MVTGYGMNTWLSVKTLGVVYMQFGDRYSFMHKGVCTCMLLFKFALVPSRTAN